MTNPSPGAKAHPGHTIALRHEHRHVTIAFAGETVADTTDAVTLQEAGCPPVLYIPPGDVERRFLEPSDHRTRCPFKGEARYWTLVAGVGRSENAVWSYDTPYDEVAAIAGHVAFYPERVDISVS